MSSEALRYLGRAIRLTREEHGVRISELAAESALAATYLEDLEAGKIDPDLLSLMLIAEALGRCADDPNVRPSLFVIRAEELERG